MFADLESNDRRLRDAFALLESGSVKRSLVEINKLIKRNPKTSSGNALKSIILLRSDKVAEAHEIMNSLMQETHTDRDTLNFMSAFAKAMDKEETLELYLMNALEKYPDNENLLVCLFFVHVRRFNFNAQYGIALKLFQLNPQDRGFRFWMALSIMLQGENQPDLAKRMFFPLAERILEKSLNEGYFCSHKDVHFYLSTLKEKMENYSKALALLNNINAIDRINGRDYKHDYSVDLLELNSKLGNWSEVLCIATDILNKDSDNWSAWKALLCHGFEDRGRMEILLKLIDRFVKDSPNCRGPYLALIDFSSNLHKRSIQHPNAEESFCIDLAKDYFVKYGRKPVGSLDLPHILPFLIKSEKNRLNFIESLIKEIRTQKNLCSLSDDERIHYEVCAYRIARTNGVALNLGDLVSAYKSHFTKIQSPEKDASKEMAPADGLLLLAISELLDPTVDIFKGGNALGRLLLAAHWLSEIGLKHSPANHIMRLRLSSILSPAGGLHCLGRLMKELNFLDLKETLNLSIGHMALAPGPALTIFGSHTQSSAPPRLPNVNLTEYYQMMVNKIQSMQREVENWLMCAYRRHAFSRVYEYTQFLNKLRHSDSLILAQTELIFNRFLTNSSSFDDALEQMGDICRKAASVMETLGDIRDNRDLSVFPEFSPRKPNPENRNRSFTHLCAWTGFRLEIVSLFGTCSKLVMKAVPCIDKIGSGELNDVSRNDLKDVVKTIESQASSLISHVNATGVVDQFDCDEFKYTDLLLTPESIFISPPPLPKVNIMSFYANGPFTQTLMAGVNLLVHLTGLLDTNSDEALDVNKHSILERFIESLMQFTGECPGIPALVSPPLDNLAFLESLSPSSALIGLGIAIESLSLAVLFVAAVVAMLRPRVFAHQFVKNATKKNRRKPPSNNQNAGTATVTATTKHFDQLAESVSQTVIPQLQCLAIKLGKVARDWTWWATNKAPEVFTAIAKQTAEAALTVTPEEDKAFPWYPQGEDMCSPIYKEIANDLAFGFDELFGACERNRLTLKAALSEIDHFNSTRGVSNMSLD